MFFVFVLGSAEIVKRGLDFWTERSRVYKRYVCVWCSTRRSTKENIMQRIQLFVSDWKNVAILCMGVFILVDLYIPTEVPSPALSNIEKKFSSGEQVIRKSETPIGLYNHMRSILHSIHERGGSGKKTHPPKATPAPTPIKPPKEKLKPVKPPKNDTKPPQKKKPNAAVVLPLHVVVEDLLHNFTSGVATEAWNDTATAT